MKIVDTFLKRVTAITSRFRPSAPDTEEDAEESLSDYTYTTARDKKAGAKPSPVEERIAVIGTRVGEWRRTASGRMRVYGADVRTLFPFHSYLFAPVLFLSVLLLLCVCGVFYRLSPPPAESVCGVTAVYLLCTLMLPSLGYMRIRRRDLSDIGIRLFSADKIILLVLTACMLIAFSVAYSAILTQLGGNGSCLPLYGIFTVPAYSAGNGTVASVATFALIPAVCEELLFRGILFTEYNRYHTVVATVTSSLLYAMLHLSPQWLLFYFVMGMVLGFIRIFTRSLLAPILCHFAHSLFVLLVQRYFGNLSDRVSELALLFFIGMLICLCVLVFILAEADRLSYNYARRAMPPIPEASRRADTSKRALRACLTSPFFLLSVAVFFILQFVF